jgi:hypothetical protein
MSYEQRCSLSKGKVRKMKFSNKSVSSIVKFNLSLFLFVNFCILSMFARTLKWNKEFLLEIIDSNDDISSFVFIVKEEEWIFNALIANQ